MFVSVDELNTQQAKWIDARFSLQDSGEGRRLYNESHVSGAIYWDLLKDLSDMSKKDGRHPMPEKDALTELFRRSGLELDDLIIVYDQGGSPFAPRAWWFLHYAGFQHAVIALEGFDELQAKGLPVDTLEPSPARSAVQPVWNEELYASREFVEQTVAGDTGSRLVDARSAVRFRGEVEPIDPIAGRIPGALNFDWEQLKEDGRFHADATLREQLASVVKPEEEVTVYCGSGVTAAPLYAMLKQAEYPNVRLYVGSYSDWISKEDAPVEKG
ncbi:sulfurtransferase [Sporosarcina sp. 179-K 3D1 HS]|uniref:sulfurtransferase n=1 Tax=Sporosarcina sp. 179-K 3D1 HS TaxID=3232169 RepID=UPI0039A09722